MGERRGTKALEMWCRRMTEGYPGVKIDNMTTSWRDGLAFCAMIHHFRPELIEFDKLNKEDVYYNNELAFSTAEKYLGIPALLDADDMAAYEVPDRLSILTYLSQFYQAFAAQDSANRLKRPSPAAEKTQINKTPGPPAKMAHVAGVLRRDPCQKCQLPVFLAERLAIGKKIFHRTCLKCARCGSQLTPGSFYETEVDNEFCCETCPDEEEQMDASTPVTAAAAASSIEDTVERRDSEFSRSTGPLNKGVRSSIADRLAFFEQAKNGEVGSPTPSRVSTTANSKLLQRSVSDEEKTKSLQRMDNSITPYKMNAALSNFLQTTVDGGHDDGGRDLIESETTTPSSSTGNSGAIATEDDTDADLSVETEAPELPKTEPPAMKAVTTSQPTTPSPAKRFSSTVQMQLSRPQTPSPSLLPETVEEEIQVKSKEIDILPKLEADIPSSGSTDPDNVNNNVAKVEQSADLEISEPNHNDQGTKDKMVDAGDAQLALNGKKANELEHQDSPAGDAKNENVELRKREPPTEQAEIEKPITEYAEDVDTTQRLSVVRARLQQFEVITNNQNNNISEKQGRSHSASPQPAEEGVTKDEQPMVQEPAESVEETAVSTSDEKEPMEVDKPETADVVPLEEEIKDNRVQPTDQEAVTEEASTHKVEEEVKLPEQKPEKVEVPQPRPRVTAAVKVKTEEYPEDLNPFKSDDEDEEDTSEANKENINAGQQQQQEKERERESLNPFDSSDDEIELEKSRNSITSTTSSVRVPPPRPPPPRISRNPFGDETDEDSSNFSRQSSLASSLTKKTPVPTPRINLSRNPTPEPTPRLGAKQLQQQNQTPSQNSGDFYGSANSLTTPPNWNRNSDLRGSSNSLTSSSGGTIRSRKNRKAPAPPPPASVKELFPSNENVLLDGSISSTPSSSTRGSPRSGRKKRPAPAPPKPARLDAHILGHDQSSIIVTGSKNLLSYPLQNESNSKLSDEEKALLEGNQWTATEDDGGGDGDKEQGTTSQRRLIIPLDAVLLADAATEEASKSDDLKSHDKQVTPEFSEDTQVVYRRIIVPPAMDKTPIHEINPLLDSLGGHASQLEKLKDNKEAKNRNRQSQQSASSGAEDADPLYNKSMHGKWKRRKGPAPALPIPPRKVLQMLPLQEIRHELEIIEVQQQGLEKQGVILEKMIRDRCEGENGELLAANRAAEGTEPAAPGEGVKNSKEVEDLILQLFELVNEKNELFRRQAELMYLRRMHRLEQEQADLEYEIRVLMAQPERNKTDTDKAREEVLIARMVEVVQLRNEVVDCLEMDRLREAEEDMSIKQQLELHTAHRDEVDNSSPKMPVKLSKKEKKKQKEAKKLSKSKKIDADKDADETELATDKLKTKKKKRKFLF